MAYELLYTSAPRGIRPGSSGFCTVAYTNGLAANVVTQLEGMSAYKAYFPHYDANAARNPVSYSHFVYHNSGVEYHILSRICFYGVDYTKRSNKLAHHIVAKKSETDHVSGGPGSVFAQEGLFRTQWTGEPQLFHDQKHLAGSSAAMRKAAAWEKYCSDSGWAGVLAEAFIKNPKKPCFIIFDPLIHTDILSLVEDALLLLPESLRWKVGFNTYFSTLPAGLECHWRFCVPDSDVLKEARRTPGTLVIDLTGKLGTPPESDFVRAARSGVAVQGECEISSAGSEDPGASGRKSADLPGKIPGKNALPGVPPPVAGLPPLPVRKKDSDMKLWIMAGILLCLLLSCGIVALCLFANSIAPKKSDRAIRLEQQLAKKKAEKEKSKRKSKAEAPKKAETPKKAKPKTEPVRKQKQQSKAEKLPVIRTQKKAKKQVKASPVKKDKHLIEKFQKISNKRYPDLKNIVKFWNLNKLADWKKKTAADLSQIGKIKEELQSLSCKIPPEMDKLKKRLGELQKEIDRRIEYIVKESRRRVWYEYGYELSELSSGKGSIIIKNIFRPDQKVNVTSIHVKIGEKSEYIRPEGNNIFRRKGLYGYKEVVSFSCRIEVDPVYNGLKITVLQPSKSKLQWQEVRTSTHDEEIYCHFSGADKCHIPFDKVKLKYDKNFLVCNFSVPEKYKKVFEQNGYERIFPDHRQDSKYNLKIQVKDGNKEYTGPLSLPKYNRKEPETRILYKNLQIVRNESNNQFVRHLRNALPCIMDLLKKEYALSTKEDKNGNIRKTKLGNLKANIKSLASKIAILKRKVKENKSLDEKEVEKLNSQIRTFKGKKSLLDKKMKRFKSYCNAKEKGETWQKAFYYAKCEKLEDFYKCSYEQMKTILEDLDQRELLDMLKKITPAGWKKYDPELPEREVKKLIRRIKASKKQEIFLLHKGRVLKDHKLEVDKK